jgi:hypothetical protein
MSEEKQVLVRFVTKLPQELQVPDTEVVGAASAWLLLLLLGCLQLQASQEQCSGADRVRL